MPPVDFLSCSALSAGASTDMTKNPVEDPLLSFDGLFDRDLYEISDAQDAITAPIEEQRLTFSHCPPSSPCEKQIQQANGFEPQDLDPWRKGLWCLNSNNTSNLAMSKIRQTQRTENVYVSPTHLVSNDNYATRCFDFNLETKTSVPNPKATSRYCNGFRFQLDRERTLSPSPMYSQLPGSNILEDSQWEQSFRDFNIDKNCHQFHAPITGTNGRRNGMSKQHRSNGSTDKPTNGHLADPAQLCQDSSLYMKTSRTRQVPSGKFDCSRSKPGGTPQNLSYSVLPVGQYTLPPEDKALPVWTEGILDQSRHMNQSHRLQFNNETHFQQPLGRNSENDWIATPYGTEIAPNGNQGQHTSADQYAQELKISIEDDSLPIAPGMVYPAIAEIGRAVTCGSTYSEPFPAATPPNLHTTANDLMRYPPFAPYTSHTLANTTPFNTPRKQKFLSRSPSPSISPTQRGSVRSGFSFSPSQSEQSHQRRKSIHKAGPIKAKDSEGHRRNRSSSRPARTPKTSGTPKHPTSGVQVDFINFTSQDSVKLMSDVAPSGSSKTRARREQEAKEKRKRLSEAARQAVQRAGGDIAAFDKALVV